MLGEPKEKISLILFELTFRTSLAKVSSREPTFFNHFESVHFGNFVCNRYHEPLAGHVYLVYQGTSIFLSLLSYAPQVKFYSGGVEPRETAGIGT